MYIFYHIKYIKTRAFSCKRDIPRQQLCFEPLDLANKEHHPLDFFIRLLRQLRLAPPTNSAVLFTPAETVSSPSRATCQPKWPSIQGATLLLGRRHLQPGMLSAAEPHHFYAIFLVLSSRPQLPRLMKCTFPCHSTLSSMPCSGSQPRRHQLRTYVEWCDVLQLLEQQ